MLMVHLLKLMADYSIMINEANFQKILDEVIDNKDKVIVLYSGLWSFIHELNFKLKNPNQIPEIILNIIEDKIGKEKTLFLPAFTGKSFSTKKIFEIDKDIDKGNGYVPLTALKRGYYRTRQPIHSYLVYGDLKEVKKLKLQSSWGRNSLLEYFSKKNARICNMGLPWNKGCAYLHRFDQIYKVPWRYNKKFSSAIVKNNKLVGTCHEIKYCSSALEPVSYDYKPFVRYIKKSDSFKKSKNQKISFESIKVSCLNKIGRKIFSKDPWIIVKNKKKTLNWIKNSKNKEINMQKSINK
jgi:aminoglycoside N3'-acetyltransferase